MGFIAVDCGSIVASSQAALEPTTVDGDIGVISAGIFFTLSGARAGHLARFTFPSVAC